MAPSMLNQRLLASTRRLCMPSRMPSSAIPSKTIHQRRCRRTTTQIESIAPAAAAGPSQASTSAPRTPSLEELLCTGARLTTAAQAVWAQLLRPGDTAVDATCGNGHDTLFLAQAVGPTGHVYAYDIQEAAIASTRQRLVGQLGEQAVARGVTLARGCHAQLLAGGSHAAEDAAAAGEQPQGEQPQGEQPQGEQQPVGQEGQQPGHGAAWAVPAPGSVRVVVFNLGYLPGGDKGRITQGDTTTAAIRGAMQLLQPGGAVSVLAYVGHPGGLAEYEAVRGLVGQLGPAEWVASETRLLNRPSAPILLLLWRRGDAPLPPGGPPSCT